MKGKAHQQFNSMYVCTLKVAGDCHGLTLQPKKGGSWTLALSEARTAQQVMAGRAGRYQANINLAVEDDSSEESD
jgi:hypothetical protein